MRTAPTPADSRPAPLSTAGALTVAVGALTAVMVLGAAVVQCVEAIAMLGGGYDAFSERSARIPPVRQAVTALVPLGIVVLAPRWARILLSVGEGRPWIAAVNRVLTIVSVAGSLAMFVVFGLTFDVMTELFADSGPGLLLLSWGMTLVVWTLFAPFTHLIGLWPQDRSSPGGEDSGHARGTRRRPLAEAGPVAEAWTALAGGEVLRALPLSLLLMLAFWTGTSDIDEVYGWHGDVEAGIVASGTGGWMLGLLAAQLGLLAILATVLRRRVGLEGLLILAVCLAIVVGVITVIDAVATRQIGVFHVIALVPVVPGMALGLWIRHRRLRDEKVVLSDRSRSGPDPGSAGCA